jgi:uncharacterized membrane protein YdbT with pleckstrin-like domain
MESEARILVPKVWRSELVLLMFFAAGCVVSIALSRYFPGSVIRGSLFRLGGSTVFLWFPIFWLIPAITLAIGCIRIYNVRHVLDSDGIETVVGILSNRQITTTVRFEDVRSAEIEQTITERILGIGNIYIGTAAQSGVEIYMEGVGAPEEVQNMIHRERDRRQRLLQNSASDRDFSTE